MKTTSKIVICSALCSTALSVFVGAPPNASQTAQSAMVDLQTDSNAYQIEGTITWTYHRDDCAVNSYNNAWNGSAPTVSCTGGGQNGCQTAPSTPPAPDPDGNKLRQHAQAERCTFFCGGTLGSDSYAQDVAVIVNNPAPQAERGNWKFTYTYDIVPKGTEEFPSAVAAHTCWTSEETGGTVNVLFDGFVSSESYLKQSNGRTKYSFTLSDSLGASRVVNASAQLQKFDGTNWADVGSAVLLGPASDGTLPVTATTADYTYFGNVGVFGNSVVYNALHAPPPGGRPATLVSAILLQDNFANNDNDLASGNVHEADFDSSFSGITEAGDYRIVLSGTIKGNAGTADQPFSVTSSQIVIGGCACN